MKGGFKTIEYDRSKLYKEALEKYNLKLDKKQDWSFYINPKTGEFELNKLCIKCKNKDKCGQSCNCMQILCKNINKDNK